MAAAVSFASAFEAEAAPPDGQHLGSAYGLSGDIQVGPLSGQLGTTAFIAMPCLGTDGVRQTSDIASASLGLAGVTLRTAAATSTVQTTNGVNKSVDEVMSRVEGLRALDGLIAANSVIAVARTTATRRAVTSDDAGTTFVGLKIAGQAIPADVLANTTVPLPGVGVATLRKTTTTGDGSNTAGISIDMISIEVTTANTLGLPVGTTVVIGHAESGFERGLPDVLYSGDAYVSLVSVNVSGTASIGAGATALQSLQCGGTNGETVIRKIAGASVPGVLVGGAGMTRIYGSRNQAKTNAKLERISLLGGLVTIKSVRAIASAKIVGRRVVRSTEGTSVADVRILGLPVLGPITDNMTLDLPGIGSITLNEKIVPGDDKPDAETVVNAVRITVSRKNVLGLPIGSRITIGHASAAVTKPKTGV